jgi:hypothetical protein
MSRAATVQRTTVRIANRIMELTSFMSLMGRFAAASMLRHAVDTRKLLGRRLSPMAFNYLRWPWTISDGLLDLGTRSADCSPLPALHCDHHHSGGKDQFNALSLNKHVDILPRARIAAPVQFPPSAALRDFQFSTAFYSDGILNRFCVFIFTLAHLWKEMAIPKCFGKGRWGAGRR